MQVLTLKRISAEPNAAVFGVLLDNNNLPFVVTLERDWLDNKKQVSCIPSGQYVCQRVNSPKFGDTFEVTNVPGRSKILLHWGNIEANSKGCILLGESFAKWSDGQTSIGSSKVAFNEFLAKLKGENSFKLNVEWCCDHN